jgi:hypothetical protein
MPYFSTKFAPKSTFFAPKTAKSDFCGRDKPKADSLRRSPQGKLSLLASLARRNDKVFASVRAPCPLVSL